MFITRIFGISYELRVRKTTIMTTSSSHEGTTRVRTHHFAISKRELLLVVTTFYVVRLRLRITHLLECCLVGQQVLDLNDAEHENRHEEYRSDLVDQKTT